MSQRESDAVFEFEGSRGEFLKILAEMGEEPAFVARAPSDRVSAGSVAQTV